jgi:hypothetical protein
MGRTLLSICDFGRVLYLKVQIISLQAALPWAHVLSSAISGYFDPEDMAYFAKEKTYWLRKFSPFKFGTPSHETLRYWHCSKLTDFGAT